jgi:hypothetical protein
VDSYLVENKVTIHDDFNREPSGRSLLVKPVRWGLLSTASIGGLVV